MPEPLHEDALMDTRAQMTGAACATAGRGDNRS
jgi:hypothetical protein